VKTKWLLNVHVSMRMPVFYIIPGILRCTGFLVQKYLFDIDTDATKIPLYRYYTSVFPSSIVKGQVTMQYIRKQEKH